MQLETRINRLSKLVSRWRTAHDTPHPERKRGREDANQPVPIEHLRTEQQQDRDARHRCPEGDNDLFKDELGEEAPADALQKGP